RRGRGERSNTVRRMTETTAADRIVMGEYRNSGELGNSKETKQLHEVTQRRHEGHENCFFLRALRVMFF
ncbi:MAG TPA: hypothetical protein VJB38_15825, partial [Bacteroidota bacterium]|nr:hypothetical protein [Bacteroidota bacterium]